MKISALWITKNEEENITRSINSAKAVVDELIVVDTGSSDNTVQIVRDLGARVEHFDWIGDFAAARNYALAQTDADIIIFLDADEWFEPTLEKNDRKRIEQIFSEPSIVMAHVTRHNYDTDMDLKMSVDFMARIFRGHGAISYAGIIHEIPYSKNDNCNKESRDNGLVIYHNGYSKEIRVQKFVRNRALLEAALPYQTDTLLKALYHYYLMRENGGLNEPDQAFYHMKWLMDHPAELRKFMRRLNLVGESFPYQALGLAVSRRKQINRRQLYASAVQNYQEIFPEQPSSIILPLHFKASFGVQSKALADEIKTGTQEAESRRKGDTIGKDTYFQSLVFLYSVAGSICWRHGDREGAFDFATKAVNLFESSISNDTISLLLRTVKGLPTTDIILFLNSTLDISSHGILQMLIAALQQEGYQDLYTYYLKKMLDDGMAKKSDFWYLMIIMGKAQEACRAAIEAKKTTDEEVVQRTLFLAVASTHDESLFHQYKDEMGKYGPPLDVWLNDADVNNADCRIVIENYKLIAFAGGREIANSMVSALKSVDDFQLAAFRERADYYNACGLYAEFLEDNQYVPSEDDTVSWLWLAECEMMCGLYSDALSIFESILASGGVNSYYFNLLDAFTSRAESETAAQARALYNAYLPMYEEYTNCQDVVNTGIVLDSDSKKQRKALSQLDIAGFEKRITSEEIQPFKGQLETLVGAAGVFAEKKSYAAAVDCLCKYISLGGASYMAYTLLAETFEALGNAALAGAMRERADELDSL